MCAIDDFVVLAQSENAQITYCKQCKSFSFTFKSSCASFTTSELDQFMKMLETLSPVDYNYHMMGKAMAIIRNSMSSLGLCLTPDDTQELIGVIRESQTLFEAFEVIYR